MMKFKIGDKVTLKEGSPYKYQQCGIGIIKELSGFTCMITWVNGSFNWYDFSSMLKHSMIDKEMQKLKEAMLLP